MLYVMVMLDSLFAWMRQYVALDLRALVLTRISLSAIILFDLWIRAQHLFEHYGDYGIFPVVVWKTNWLPQGYWSLHLLSGNPYWSLALMSIAALCAVALFFGWRTKVATVALWLLTVSLNHADPFILQGGDNYLTVILFLSIFLPLGTSFSLDSAETPPSTKNISTPWTFVYIVQLGLFYLTAATLKNGSAWQEGSAVYYALSINGFDLARTTLGDLLYRSEFLMELCTYAVHTLQWLVLPFFLFPLRTPLVRGTIVFLLMSMHLSFALTMHLGFFSWIAITALIPLLPGSIFDFAKKFFARFGFGNITIYYDDTCGFCRLSSHAIRLLLLLPGVRVLPAQTDTSIYHDMQKGRSWVIVDDRGTRYFTYLAFVRIIRASPFLFILTPLLSLPFCVALGERGYAYVATHRPRIPFKLHTPHRQRISFESGVLAVGAVAYLIFIFTLNGIVVGRILETTSTGERLTRIAIALGVQQRWNMFTPEPVRTGGWLMAIGLYSDGTEKSLLPRPHTISSYDTPEDIDDGSLYFDSRRRKYAFNVSSYSISASHANSFGKYLCFREKNRAHGISRKVPTEIKLVAIRRLTLPEYKQISSRVTLLVYPCQK